MDPPPSSNSQNPHLASILQDLVQFTNGAAAQKTRLNARAASLQTDGRVADGDGGTINTGSSASGIAQDSRLTATRKPSTTTSDTLKPACSSKDIVEWSSAVKFVMNTLSRSPDVAFKVKGLIKNQSENEQQWWIGREALVKKHRGREEARRKLESLKLLGPVAANTAHLKAGAGQAATIQNNSRPSSAQRQQQQEEEEIELRNFDRKVYSALQQMAVAMDRELTTLGVPFFAIRHGLIAAQTSGKSEAGTEGGDGRLSKTELRELQKKMLLLLQDLFGD